MFALGTNWGGLMVVTGTSPPTVQAQSLLSRLLGRKGTQGKSELPGRGARPDGSGAGSWVPTPSGLWSWFSCPTQVPSRLLSALSSCNWSDEGSACSLEAGAWGLAWQPPPPPLPPTPPEGSTPGHVMGAQPSRHTPVLSAHRERSLNLENPQTVNQSLCSRLWMCREAPRSMLLDARCATHRKPPL